MLHFGEDAVLDLFTLDLFNEKAISVCIFIYLSRMTQAELALILSLGCCVAFSAQLATASDHAYKR